jgi:hypothetical protein
MVPPTQRPEASRLRRLRHPTNPCVDEIELVAYDPPYVHDQKGAVRVPSHGIAWKMCYGPPEDSRKVVEQVLGSRYIHLHSLDCCKAWTRVLAEQQSLCYEEVRKEF